MKKPAAEREAGVGEVRLDAIYSKEELCRRLDWKEWAWRQARRRGLRVIRFGRCLYVTGADLFEFFERLAGQDNRGGKQTA